MILAYYPIAGAPRNICAGYGNRTYPDGSVKLHDACDLCAPLGSPIVAPADGTAKWGVDAVGGNVIVVTVSDGSAWYLAHALDVQSGSRVVRAGQALGRVGMSGNAKGTVPHCHTQLWPTGQFVPGSVHPDPTAALLAAPVLSAPLGASPWPARILVAAAVASGVVLAAMAVEEWRRPGFLLPWRTA